MGEHGNGLRNLNARGEGTLAMGRRMWSSEVGADVLEAHGAGAVGGVVDWRGVWGLGDGHVVYAGHHGGDVFNAVVGPGWCCQIYGGSWVRGAVCSFRWRSHGALEDEHNKSKVIQPKREPKSRRFRHGGDG